MLRLFPLEENPRPGSSGFVLSPAAATSPLAGMALSLAMHMRRGRAPAIDEYLWLLQGDSGL